MRFIIRGQKIEVTKPIKDYIVEKVSKLDKYFNNPDDIRARVTIKVKGTEQTVEVTIIAMKFTLRVEVSQKDLYASIDLVVDKLERQIRKNKTKMQVKKVKTAFDEFNLDIESDEDNKNSIIKRKKLETKPMSEDEAVLQMELLSHDFFIFKNSRTHNISVVYKRKDGNYGIIDAK